MGIGLIGKKVGMTRVFGQDGKHYPATLVKVEPNFIVQVKDKSKDGYTAFKITTGLQKVHRLNKAEKGIFAKSKVAPGKGFWELSYDDSLVSDEIKALKVGDSVGLDVLKGIARVDVRGVSKGKGFQGGVKRHNFKMQDATHGNSVSHRVIGSTGQNQTPGRVFKGKKMAGQMGNEFVSSLGLAVLFIDKDLQLVALHGAVPGAKNGFVYITESAKKRTFEQVEFSFIQEDKVDLDAVGAGVEVESVEKVS